MGSQDGMRVALAGGLVATLESAADGAWLVYRDGVPLYHYQLTAADRVRLAEALAEATYRASRRYYRHTIR